LRGSFVDKMKMIREMMKMPKIGIKVI